MEFNFRGIDDRTVPYRSSPSPSSQSSSDLSDDQALRGNYSMDPNLLNHPRHFHTIQREIERQIIRREIITREVIAAEIERRVGMGFGHDVLPPTMPHFSRGLWCGLDVNKKDKRFMLGKPDSNICGSKQKAATPLAGSGELPSASLSKPKEWSCALCQVSATTERGLDVHLQGNKHRAKVAGLLRDKKMCGNSTSSTSNKSTKSRGGAGRKMKTKVQEESVKANKNIVGLNQKVKGGLDERLQGKKHKAKVAGLLRDKKMCGNSTSSTSKKSTESRVGAGQKMKTIVQEESVKANKTVVGINQKVKGGLNDRLHGKKHKAKVAGLLRVKKMCSNSTSSTSKKSTESRGGAGQKMKPIVQEESVKANKTVVGLNQNVKGGLDEHLQGKKHKAKVAGLLRDKKMCSNSTSSSSKKSTESRGGAGQKMKTKVQEESVKANKTVGGLNHKVKGGLDEHPQGKKDEVKEELLRDQKWKKIYIESRDGLWSVLGINEKDKWIMLGKPYPNLCGSKQEAATLPADSGNLRLTSSKKPMHWSCALCQVSATSKRGLDEHLQGKKHKAKEAELLGPQKMCTTSSSSTSKESGKIIKLTESRDSASQEMKAKVEEESVKAIKTVVGLDQKVEGEDDSGNKNKQLPEKDLIANTQKTTIGIPTAEMMKRKLPPRKNFEFWCEDCQVGTHSAVVMEGHKRGKKHMARSNESKKNDEAVPLTTSTTIVTPSEPTEKVEYEDVVAEESSEETADSDIEKDEDEEVVVYRGRQWA